MKKRLLTLLLATSPVKAKADTLTVASTPRRPAPAASGTRGPDDAQVARGPAAGEVPLARHIDDATVRRVLAARLTPGQPELPSEPSSSPLPSTMFQRAKLAEPRARRKISLRPAGFWGGGKGIKIKVRF